MLETIQFKCLHPEAQLPTYATSGSAGADICAVNQGVVMPWSLAKFQTGLGCLLPPNRELQIRSRSGLAAKHNVFVLNSPGTIDSDYRGEIIILLFNLSEDPYYVKAGDRIAQAVLAPVLRAEYEWQPYSLNLEDITERGAGGFGSTGR